MASGSFLNRGLSLTKERGSTHLSSWHGSSREIPQEKLWRKPAKSPSWDTEPFITGCPLGWQEAQGLRVPAATLTLPPAETAVLGEAPAGQNPCHTKSKTSAQAGLSFHPDPTGESPVQGTDPPQHMRSGLIKPGALPGAAVHRQGATVGTEGHCRPHRS